MEKGHTKPKSQIEQRIEELETEIRELKKAASDVLPVCYTTVEFMQYSSPEWKAYLKLKNLVEV